MRRLQVAAQCRGRCLRVEVKSDQAHYTLQSGDALEVVHHGETFTVEPGASQSRKVPPPPHRPVPEQPPGRAPRRRHGQD